MNGADTVYAIQNAFWLAGEDLLFHHTNPWELDEALTAWGYAVGPCEAQDHVGLEPVLARPLKRSSPVLPRMVAEGRMGKIGGVGYYRYPGGGGAVIDPLIEDLIREEAWFAKVDRSEVDDSELVQRMNACLCAAVGDLGLKPACAAPLLSRAVHFPPSRLTELDLR